MKYTSEMNFYSNRDAMTIPRLTADGIFCFNVNSYINAPITVDSYFAANERAERGEIIISATDAISEYMENYPVFIIAYYIYIYMYTSKNSIINNFCLYWQLAMFFIFIN